jgi:hypothetical protein
VVGQLVLFHLKRIFVDLHRAVQLTLQLFLLLIVFHEFSLKNILRVKTTFCTFSPSDTPDTSVNWDVILGHLIGFACSFLTSFQTFEYRSEFNPLFILIEHFIFLIAQPAISFRFAVSAFIPILLVYLNHLLLFIIIDLQWLWQNFYGGGKLLDFLYSSLSSI